MTLQAQRSRAAPARKHLRNGLIIAGAVLAVLAIIGTIASNGTTYTVTLQASGGAAMDVTYGVGGKNSQDTSAASPWQASYKVSGDVPFVSMVVQNGGGGSGSVSCSITEDGHVVSSNTSYGAYAVVQCSG